MRRWEIEQHQQDFDDNGIIDGPVPIDILKWPGRGNPQFIVQMGFPLADQDMAPFYDRNNNNVYEPLLGDYPVYDHGRSDAVAEDMLWWIFNDAGNRHLQSGGQSLGAEIHATAWSFQCQGDSLLNRTIYLRHAIHNKSISAWYNFRAGLWHDPKIGCGSDDYIGVDTTLRPSYWYNQDTNEDHPCGPNGNAGYGNNPPVQAMTLLNQPLHAYVYHTGSYSDSLGTPIPTVNYYQHLNGVFMDGTPMTVGGSGYDPNSSAPTTRYAFFDPPLQMGGWSMYQENLGSSDQYTLTSTRQDTIPSGGVFTLDVAYSYHRRTGNNHLQNVDIALQEIAQIQQWYDNNFNFINCAQPTPCTNNCVYPGDMNNNGIANDYDLLELAVAMGNGSVVAPRTAPDDNWFPYALPTPATNGYIDADGNGLLNETDWDVNTDNLYGIHNLYTGASEGFNTIGPELKLNRYYYSTIAPFPFSPPNLDTFVQRGDKVHFTVELADPTLPIPNLYALLFKIDYDTTVLEARLSIGQVGVRLGGNASLPLLGGKIRYREEQGRLHYIHARLDGQDQSVYGQLGFLLFRVKPLASITIDTMRTSVCFRDFMAIDADGTVIPIGAQCATVEYYDSNYLPSVVPIDGADYSAQLYPNPTQDQTTLRLDLIKAQTIRVQLLDVTGRIVYQHPTQDLPQGQHSLQLPVGALPTGVYYCQIASDRQQQVLTLVKSK